MKQLDGLTVGDRQDIYDSAYTKVGSLYGDGMIETAHSCPG